MGRYFLDHIRRELLASQGEDGARESVGDLSIDCGELELDDVLDDVVPVLVPYQVVYQRYHLINELHLRHTIAPLSTYLLPAVGGAYALLHHAASVLVEGDAGTLGHNLIVHEVALWPLHHLQAQQHHVVPVYVLSRGFSCRVLL